MIREGCIIEGWNGEAVLSEAGHDSSKEELDGDESEVGRPREAGWIGSLRIE